MSSAAVTIRPVETKKDRKAFVDFAWEVYKDDPHWVPPLKDEVHGLITPGKNPWFEHARAGRRSGPATYGARYRAVGLPRSARRRGRGGPDRHSGGLAAQPGHEE